MLSPLAPLARLQARLDEAIGLVPVTQAGGLVSLVLELPQPLTLPPDLDGQGFVFSHSQGGELRAGYGIAAEWTAQGPGRLRALSARAQALMQDWRQVDPDETGFTGFAFIGFAASASAPRPRVSPRPWGGPCSTPPASPASASDTGRDRGCALPNALLWVPELALGTRRGQAALVLTTRLPVVLAELRERWYGWLARLVSALQAPLPEPLTPSPLRLLGSLPDLGDWRTLVDAALAEIRHGPLEKVVLCRRVGLRGRRPFDPRRLIAALSYLFPSCQVISLHRGATRFLAATPERLLSVSGRHVVVDAIAGTAARSCSADADAALTAALQTSAKERREHDLVVGAVRAVLADCCDRLEVPSAPQVMQLHNAQHLWSPMSGRLRADCDLLALAERLHPTPATNGKPQRLAREWLARREPLDRGWYTGAAGILEPDASGRFNGELWVLLRCAEVSGDCARLYAGAGIVPGSDPLAEWRETGHKLAAMAAALQYA